MEKQPTREEQFMYRCLQLASYGKGFTAPNPLVGAVVVFEDRIIGEGFHRRCGEAHAEVNAIQSVKNENLLADSTLYVNLEPCSHYGKTPPCAELIIRKKIPRVVIGMKDPFPSVAGKGIQRLKEAGVEVKCGVLENECFRLNRRFLRCIQNQRPYIILKWAQSSDGFIDRFRDKGSTENPVRFSTDFTQLLVHKLRAEEAAITVGSRTEELDHPLLNVRFWAGKDPQKIRFDSKEPLEKQLQKLYTEGIQSLIVEGGAALLSSFIQTRLWDEARIEVSDIILKKGVKAPILGILPDKSLKCENSILFYNNTEIIS